MTQLPVPIFQWLMDPSMIGCFSHTKYSCCTLISQNTGCSHGPQGNCGLLILVGGCTVKWMEVSTSTGSGQMCVLRRRSNNATQAQYLTRPLKKLQERKLQAPFSKHVHYWLSSLKPVMALLWLKFILRKAHNVVLSPSLREVVDPLLTN